MSTLKECQKACKVSNLYFKTAQGVPHIESTLFTGLIEFKPDEGDKH